MAPHPVELYSSAVCTDAQDLLRIGCCTARCLELLLPVLGAE